MAPSPVRLICLLGLMQLALQQDAGIQPPPQPAGAPRAVIREIGHDFGPGGAGGTITHTFAVHNRGNAPLLILGVDTSHPDMRAEFTTSIEPGGAGTVVIRWTPAQPTGPLDGEAVVHLSDPKKPRVTLRLTGVVRTSIAIRPSSEVFMSLYPDEAGERRVSIVNNEERPLTITGIRTAGEHLDATLATVEDGRKYELVISMPSGLRPGRYTGDVFVETDHPRLGPLRVVVNTVVRDSMYATPDVVDFGDIDLARVRASEAAPWLSQSATIVKRKGDFRITAITSDIEGLRVDRSPSGQTRTVGLVVTLDRRRLKAGDLEGTIRIRTDDRQFPVVELPVRARIQ